MAEKRTKPHRITLSLNDKKFEQWSTLIKKEDTTSQKKLEKFVDTELKKHF